MWASSRSHCCLVDKEATPRSRCVTQKLRSAFRTIKKLKMGMCKSFQRCCRRRPQVNLNRVWSLLFMSRVSGFFEGSLCLWYGFHCVVSIHEMKNDSAQIILIHLPKPRSFSWRQDHIWPLNIHAHQQIAAVHFYTVASKQEGPRFEPQAGWGLSMCGFQVLPMYLSFLPQSKHVHVRSTSDYSVLMRQCEREWLSASLQHVPCLSPIDS